MLSKVHVVFCVPGNTIPLSWSFGRSSAQTYQSRNGDRESLRADWNQGWASEVWLTTRSTITRSPSAFAWFMSSTKSPGEPCFGWTP